MGPSEARPRCSVNRAGAPEGRTPGRPAHGPLCDSSVSRLRAVTSPAGLWNLANGHTPTECSRGPGCQHLTLGMVTSSLRPGSPRGQHGGPPAPGPMSRDSTWAR